MLGKGGGHPKCSGHTLEEIESIQNDLKGRSQAEIRLRKIITSFKCSNMKALSTIDAMKAIMEAIKEKGQPEMLS